jgi:hypothetical protein
MFVGDVVISKQRVIGSCFRQPNFFFPFQRMSEMRIFLDVPADVTRNEWTSTNIFLIEFV